MKRTQVIRIIPSKKKNNSNNKGKKYFNKLSKNTIGHLLSFFNEEEQLKLIKIDNKFKSAILSINEVEESDAKNWFKYICALMKLKNYSKGFASYLNVYLNINIINLNTKFFSVNSNNINRIKIVKKILEDNYQETRLDKLLIQINDPEDFNLYFSLLSSMKKEVLINLKYEIDISPLIDIKNEKTLDPIKKLFSLISFKLIT